MFLKSDLREHLKRNVDNRLDRVFGHPVPIAHEALQTGHTNVPHKPHSIPALTNDRGHDASVVKRFLRVSREPDEY
jgi:hypothetical protein